MRKTHLNLKLDNDHHKHKHKIVQAIGGRNRKGELVTGTRQAEIDFYHVKRQIDPDKHNYKHRGKTAVDKIVKLD